MIFHIFFVVGMGPSLCYTYCVSPSNFSGGDTSCCLISICGRILVWSCLEGKTSAQIMFSSNTFCWIGSSRPICFNSLFSFSCRFKSKLRSSSFVMSCRVMPTFYSNIDVCGCAPALIRSKEFLTSRPSLWFSSERIPRSNRTWSRLNNTSASFIFRWITCSIRYSWCDVNSSISSGRCLGRALAHFGSLFNMWGRMETVIVFSLLVTELWFEWKNKPIIGYSIPFHLRVHGWSNMNSGKGWIIMTCTGRRINREFAPSVELRLSLGDATLRDSTFGSTIWFVQSLCDPNFTVLKSHFQRIGHLNDIKCFGTKSCSNRLSTIALPRLN